MEELRVPKRLFPVELVLSDGTTLTTGIFLAESSGATKQRETLSELLNRSDRFIPTLDDATLKFAFLNRMNIATARLKTTDAAPGATEGAYQHGCEVIMAHGARHKGRVRFDAERDRTRLLDHLNNTTHLFLTLLVDDDHLLINKRHITTAYISTK